MSYCVIPNYFLMTLCFSVVKNVDSIVTELNNKLAKINS